MGFALSSALLNPCIACFVFDTVLASGASCPNSFSRFGYGLIVTSELDFSHSS